MPSSIRARRIAAAALVSVFAFGAVGAVAVPAYAIPAAPTITSPQFDLDTVGPNVTVEGTISTSSATDTVQVRWSGEGGVDIGCEVTLAAGTTDFSCTPNVPGQPGVYTLTARHSDVATPGEADWSPDSTAITVRVGSTDPVVFTSHTGYSNSWTTLAPTLGGTGPIFGSVLVELSYYDFDNPGDQVVEYCTVDEVPLSGIWSCEGTPSPVWGYPTFEAYGTDALGNPTVISSFDDQIGGEMLPAPPTADFTFGPASIGVTIQGRSDFNVFGSLYSSTSFSAFGYCPISGGAANPVETCSFEELDPGVWEFYALQEAGFITGFEREDYIMIPEAPGLSVPIVNANRSVTFSGTGEPGYTVFVLGNGNNEICESVVDSNASWVCTASPSSGTAGYRAIQQATGFEADAPVSDLVSSYAGFSVYSDEATATVPLAPLAPPANSAPRSSTPTPSSPLPWNLQGYDGGPLTPGQSLTLSAQGLPAGTQVVIEIRSTPQVLGSAVADINGAFSIDVTLPQDLEPGNHTIVGIATPPGGVESAVSIPVAVVAATDETAATDGTVDSGTDQSAAEGAGNGSGASSGEAGERADLAAPSVISDSIPTIDRIVRTPLLIVASGGLALAILLLVVLPAELLNSTIESNTRRLGRWYAAVEKRVDRATDWFAAVTHTRAAAAAILVLLTSAIFGFVDPGFGFDPVSLRMTISLALGLFIVTYGASWISGAIIRRAWNIETRVTLQPAALVFAVVGVVIARLLEFSPGFLVGLVIGMDLVSRVGSRYRVRAMLTNIGVIVGLALLAWVAYSLLAAGPVGEPSFIQAFASEALVATTAEGLTAALAALLPLGFLEGQEIFRRSKLLWAACFGTVATIFALLVLPTSADGADGVTNIGFWILVMVIFAAVVMTLWAILHFTNRANDAEDQELEAESLAMR